MNSRNVAGESFLSSVSEADYCIDALATIQDNTYYHCFRGPYALDLPNLDKLKVVAQVRHPLDCLTSGYFSFTVSHKLPPDPEKQKDFIAHSEKLKQMGIDDYVKNNVSSYIKRFDIVTRIFDAHPDIYLAYYEDMVLDNLKWQEQILEFLGGSIDYLSFQAKLKGHVDFSVPDKENIASHKRKVAPGDYLEKLKPETIDYALGLINSRAASNSVIHRYT